MIDETYRLALSESSKLKLRALAVRAEGREDASFRAAVLFHAAARAERRALLLLEAPDPETRLRSAIEQCGCLLDGRDPDAIEAWGEVLEASEDVPARVASAMRARIDPGFAAFVEAYREVMKGAPEVAAGLRGLQALSQAARGKVRRALSKVLAAFPGDATGWAMLSALDSAEGAFEAAWASIGRARELQPDRGWVNGMALLLVPDALPKERAEEYLEAGYAVVRRGRAVPEVCLAFAVASLRGAEEANGERRRRDLDRVLEAVAVGESQAPPVPEYVRFFRALRRIARELREDRKPGIDLLYRAGLGVLVARAGREGERDPLAILAREVGALGGRLHRAA